MIQLLLPAFLLSIVLLGIHSWYGVRIIRRGIIFTDLAIGQMAALGAAMSFTFMHGHYVYPASLAFALLGGLAIAMILRKGSHHEAFIGLLYAFGISGVFILLSRAPHGMESFQNLMAYDILFTRTDEVIRVAVLYILIGTILLVSEKKLSGTIRELVFFLTFAVTVTSSVQLAGVLIVFAILVAPALVAIHLDRLPAWRRLFGQRVVVSAWVVGLAVNTASVMVSYTLDLPTGYTLVFSHALVAMLVSFILPETV